MNKKIMVSIAALAISCSTASAAEYETGVRIGRKPTVAQVQFRQNQLRIQSQVGFRHESKPISYHNYARNGRSDHTKARFIGGVAGGIGHVLGQALARAIF